MNKIIISVLLLVMVGGVISFTSNQRDIKKEEQVAQVANTVSPSEEVIQLMLTPKTIAPGGIGNMRALYMPAIRSYELYLVDSTGQETVLKKEPFVQTVAAINRTLVNFTIPQDTREGQYTLKFVDTKTAKIATVPVEIKKIDTGVSGGNVQAGSAQQNTQGQMQGGVSTTISQSKPIGAFSMKITPITSKPSSFKISWRNAGAGVLITVPSSQPVALVKYPIALQSATLAREYSLYAEGEQGEVEVLGVFIGGYDTVGTNRSAFTKQFARTESSTKSTVTVTPYTSKTTRLSTGDTQTVRSVVSEKKKTQSISIPRSNPTLVSVSIAKAKIGDVFTANYTIMSELVGGVEVTDVVFVDSSQNRTSATFTKTSSGMVSVTVPNTLVPGKYSVHIQSQTGTSHGKNIEIIK